MVRMNLTVHIPQKNQVYRSQQPQKLKNATDLFALLACSGLGQRKVYVFHLKGGVMVKGIAHILKMNYIAHMKNVVHSFVPVGTMLPVAN